MRRLLAIVFTAFLAISLSSCLEDENNPIKNADLEKLTAHAILLDLWVLFTHGDSYFEPIVDENGSGKIRLYNKLLLTTTEDPALSADLQQFVDRIANEEPKIKTWIERAGIDANFLKVRTLSASGEIIVEDADTAKRFSMQIESLTFTSKYENGEIKYAFDFVYNDPQYGKVTVSAKRSSPPELFWAALFLEFPDLRVTTTVDTFKAYTYTATPFFVDVRYGESPKLFAVSDLYDILAARAT